jgi:serine protease Do
VRNLFAVSLGRKSLSAALLAAALLASAPSAAFARPAPDNFADLVDKVAPSVVNISVTGGAAGDDANSLGSGFIVDSKGVIVTNNHVVADSDDITVVLWNGEQLRARVAGRDPATDIAILRVTPRTPLSAARWGDSKTARVGEWVLALGNPFGLGSSASVGIISARNRDLRAGRYDDFIQTDAAINRGSSGGPLFNMDGDVIGVTSALVSPSGNSVGVGFAAPSEAVQRIVAGLIEDGSVSRGWIGITAQDPGPELAAPAAAPGRGALVAALDPNGPAAKAGLRAGDVIYSFDAKTVTDTRVLNRMVADSVGKRVRIDFQRGAKRHYILVAIGAKESAAAPTRPNGQAPAVAGVESNGLTLLSLTPALRKKYGVKDVVDGVVVTAIAPDSDAAAKVQVGDVIMKVDFDDVRTPGEAKRKMETGAAAKPILLAIHRDGATTYRSLKRAQ